VDPVELVGGAKADFDLPTDRSFDLRVVQELHRDNLVCSKGDVASDKDSQRNDFVDINAENTIRSVGVRKHVCNFEPSGSISSGWSQIAYNLITLIDDWYLIDDTVSEVYCKAWLSTVLSGKPSTDCIPFVDSLDN